LVYSLIKIDFLESLFPKLLVTGVFSVFVGIVLWCLLAKSLIFLLIPLKFYPNPNVSLLEFLLVFRLDSTFGPLLVPFPAIIPKFLKPPGLRLFLLIDGGAD
jgi:hypothetical protein